VTVRAGSVFSTFCAAGCLALLGAVSPVAAQGVSRLHVPPGLSVVPRGSLTFKRVFPGIPVSVPALDPLAGRFEIKGPPSASIRVELILPDAMTTDGGARLALTFGARDGVVDIAAAPGQVFNPHAPVVGSLGADGRLMVHLGGTALPTREQVKGIYKATIFLTVADVGI
jgi:hypothetical protein